MVKILFKVTKFIIDASSMVNSCSEEYTHNPLFPIVPQWAKL